MASLLKWLLGIILFVVLLLAAAVVVVPMVVDPNDYKPQIVSKAKETLGRDFAIERDLSLSVFPWLGVQTGGVRVGNAEGFSDQPFAEVEELGLKAKLLPLLTGKIEVDTLVVKGLRLNLEKDAKGKTNWQDLAAGDDAPPTRTEEVKKDRGPGLTLQVQGVQIEDARISWDDRQAGEKYVLDGVRLVTGALTPGSTVPVEAGVVFTSSKPKMKLDIRLDANVSSDADLQMFDASKLVLQLDAEGEGLPAGGAALTLKTRLQVDLKADSLKLDDLEISGPAMAASGNVAISSLQTAPAAKGTLRLAETNPKTLASMFASPIETTDAAALTKASGDLKFSYADGALKFDPLTIRLDDSNLTGHLYVLDTKGPVVRTKLTLDQIDLDRYMAPPNQATSARGKENATPAPDDPFAALRTLDFVGEFTVGKLKVSNARMSNLSTKVVSRKGVLKVDPMTAQLYQGKFAGSVAVDARSKTPKISAEKHLTGIQVGELLKDVVGEDRLIGHGELHLDVTTVGLSEAEVRRSLNGTSRFAFKDGALKGVNIAQIIRDASGKLGGGGQTTEASASGGQTDFSELSGSMKMTNGVIRNQDLQAKSPLLRIEGKGNVNLPENSIDYLVVTEIVGSLQGQGGKGREELRGIPIPVRVSGSLDSPKYRPDLEAALSAQAKAKLEEKKEELKQKAEEKVKEKVGDALKGLFK
jgi:AsmA protein